MGPGHPGNAANTFWARDNPPPDELRRRTWPLSSQSVIVFWRRSPERVPQAPQPLQTPPPPHPTFRSQILICESIVPVPKMSPSGWNWAQVRAAGTQGESQRLGEAFLGEKSLELQGPGAGGAKSRPCRLGVGNSALPQPELSSVTLVRTRPVWMSEKAQYCRRGAEY